MVSCLSHSLLYKYINNILTACNNTLLVKFGLNLNQDFKKLRILILKNKLKP